MSVFKEAISLSGSVPKPIKIAVVAVKRDGDLIFMLLDYSFWNQFLKGLDRYRSTFRPAGWVPNFPDRLTISLRVTSPAVNQTAIILVDDPNNFPSQKVVKR